MSILDLEFIWFVNEGFGLSKKFTESAFLSINTYLYKYT